MEHPELEQPSVPTRITIDFRDAMDPHRGWIVGVRDGSSRVELLAFESRPEAATPPGQLSLRALDDGCTCPEFCERDHANE